MKDNFFEMLLNLFEMTLSQIKDHHESKNAKNIDSEKVVVESIGGNIVISALEIFKKAGNNSIRVFTNEEQMKLTKASYQFLMRIKAWGFVTYEMFELIISKLIFSESRFVSLQETKWTIRNTLANSLDVTQLAFLDLVLYHAEDELLLH